MRILPTPPPSGFIDTEASTNTFFAPLQEDTRQYVVRFSGDFSPSNDLEFAIGGDANGDGDLSPEETEARFGVDCGEKKVKVEGVGVQRRSGILSASEQESNLYRPLRRSQARRDQRAAGGGFVADRFANDDLLLAATNDVATARTNDQPPTTN